MSSKKISALDDGGALQGTDELVVARSGTNVRLAGSAVAGAPALAAETSARAAADALLVPLTQKGAASGVATLDSAGHVPAAQLGNSIPAHYDPRLQFLGAELKRILSDGSESLALGWQTDSTGNDVPSGANTGDWPYEFGLLLGAAYPGYTVDWHLFSDASQDYAAPVRVQTGAAGERYLRFPGTGASYCVQNSAIQAAPSTQLDVSAKLSLDNWTPAGSNTIFALFGAAGQRAIRFQALTSGKLYLETSADGSTLLAHTSTVALGFTNGTTNYVRATFQGDNGASGHDVKFYTSSDGVTWTQLGTTVTTAGTSSIFAATGIYEIGGRQGTSELATGNFYRVKVRSTIGGPLVAPAMPEHWTPFSSTSPSGPTGAPVLALLAGAVAGMGLPYLTDTTRLKMMLPDYGIRAAFLATSHNDSGLRDRSWSATWATWLANVRAQAYQATPVIVTENPRFSPALNITDSAIRRQRLLTLAGQLGVPVLDAYQAFIDTGRASHYVNASDGIHPRLDVQAGDTYSGAQIWAQDAYKAMLGVYG